MAIGFRGSRTATSSTGSVGISATASWTTAAPQAGDLLVAAATCYDPTLTDAFLNTPTGWTLITQIGTPVGANELRLYVKAWQATDTTYTFSEGSGSAPFMTVDVIALSGADTANPNAGLSGTSGTGTSVTVASVTAAAANCWLVGAAFQTDTTAAFSSTGTMTSQATTSETGAGTRSILATEPLTAAGATGARTLTAGAAGSGWAAIGLAIREAAAAVVTPTTGSPGNQARRPFAIPYDPRADHIAQLTDEDDLFILGAM